MRTLIFGPGWLGVQFLEYLNTLPGWSATVSGNNILDTVNVRREVMDKKPELVINCAGKCGVPNIDWCEATTQNRDMTEMVNAFGPRILLDSVRKESGAFFVHLSSGCLWDAVLDRPPIQEHEVPEPPSFYSQTKADGEMGILGQSDVLIVRLRMPVDTKPNPRNLIDKLKGYEFVLDEPNSVTLIPTLLDAVQWLASDRRTGIYNVVNGDITGAGLMRLYQKHVDGSHTFTPIFKADLYDKGLARSKRSNCILSTKKLRLTGFGLPDFEEEMVRCMVAYGAY